MKKIFLFWICFCLTAAPALADYAAGSQQAQEQLDFAHGLFQKEIFEMAQREYEEFITKYPDSPLLKDASFGKAEAVFFQKDYEQAVQAFTEFSSLFPADARIQLANLRLLQAQHLSGQFSAAATSVQNLKLEQLPPEYHEYFYYYEGLNHFKQNQLSEAAVSFKKALSLTSDSRQKALIKIKLAEIAQTSGDTQSAFSMIDEVMMLTDDTVIKAFALFKKGELYFVKGKYEEAASVYADYIAKYPAGQQFSNALLNQLRALINLKRFEDVIAVSTSLTLAAVPFVDQVDIYFVLVDSYLQIDQPDKAIEVLNQVSQLGTLDAEKSQEYDLKLLFAKLAQKNYQAVIDLIGLKFTDKHVHYKQSQFIKAESLYQLQQYDNAMKAYNKVLEFKDNQEWQLESLYGKAYCLYKLGDIDRSILVFKKYLDSMLEEPARRQTLLQVLTIADEHLRYQDIISLTHLYLNDYAQTEEAPHLLIEQARAFAKLNEKLSAITGYQLFIEQYSRHERLAEVQFEIGFLYQGLEQYEEALDAYSKIQSTADNWYYAALKNSALIYLHHLDKPRLAAKQYYKIINAFASNELDSKMHIWVVDQLQQQELYKEAAEVLDKIGVKFSDEPTQTALHFYLGKNYQLQNKDEEAIKQYKMVQVQLTENPYLGLSILDEGISYKKLKQYKQAQQILEQVVESYASDHLVTMKARFALAEIAQLQGNIEEAYKLFLLISVLYDEQDIVPNAMLQAASVATDLQKPDDAVKIYLDLVQRYGQSEAADVARQKLEAVQ